MADICILSYEVLGAVSMTAVFVNSFSGSINSIIKRNINYKAGILFSLCSIPAVILGNIIRTGTSNSIFNILFGLFLSFTAIFLFVNNRYNNDNNQEICRTKILLGIPVSIVIGFISSFFGVGGGFLFIPFFIFYLKYSVKSAASTTQFILVFISLVVIILSIIGKQYQIEVFLMVFLLSCIIIGSLIGSYLREIFHGKIIIKILSIMMFIAGIKILLSFLFK